MHTFFQVPDFLILAAVKEAAVISMLSMIPARLAQGDNYFSRSFYLYGIGTLPSCQNQGLSRLLMDCAKKLARSMGYDFLFLVPATKKLVSFYEKQGFSTKTPQAASSPSLPDSAEMVPVSLNEYLSLRENLEKTAGVFSLLPPFSSYSLEMLSEHLSFYKEPSSDKGKTVSGCEAKHTLPVNGFCFYKDEKKPFLKLLEQTASSLNLSGGLLHQVFPLNRILLPDNTYFQFPMDDIDNE